MFDEVRLPDNIERGASIGPSFLTVINTLQSGAEQRNIQYIFPRLLIDASYGVQSKQDYEQILEFFYARQGRARGFRFKDWTDFQITNTAIGIGDGSRTQFQIHRAYTSGTVTFNRPITKPIGSTFTFTVNGSPTTPASVDDTTGVVTFSSAPALSAVIAVTSGEFDVPVRFDTDTLQASALLADAASFPSIPLIELRQSLQALT